MKNLLLVFLGLIILAMVIYLATRSKDDYEDEKVEIEIPSDIDINFLNYDDYCDYYPCYWYDGWPWFWYGGYYYPFYYYGGRRNYRYSRRGFGPRWRGRYGGGRFRSGMRSGLGPISVFDPRGGVRGGFSPRGGMRGGFSPRGGMRGGGRR